MPSTGLTFPGTGANNSGAGTVAWSNPGNITGDEGSNATANNLGVSTTQYLQGTNFGFSIPDGAEIAGVIVTMERGYTTDSGSPQVSDQGVQLIISGSRAGTIKQDAFFWNASATVAAYGSSTDLWGNTLSPAIVNASNFGVALRAQNASGQADLFCDYFRINVFYRLGRSRGFVIT